MRRGAFFLESCGIGIRHLASRARVLLRPGWACEPGSERRPRPSLVTWGSRSAGAAAGCSRLPVQCPDLSDAVTGPAAVVGIDGSVQKAVGTVPGTGSVLRNCS